VRVWRAALDRREWVIGLCASAALAAVAAALWRMRQQRAQQAHRGYARALQLLARRGLVRRDAVTARAFARDVSSSLPATTATAFAALTEVYLRERFGARAADGAGALARFESSLRSRNSAD
jgi:hypothetical protein